MSTAHTATLKLKLKSTSGYTEDSTYTNVSPKKFGRVVRVLNDMDPHDDLVAMLREIVAADDAAIAELAAMGAPATLGVSALTEKARALIAKVSP
jgi:hypothetical protein